MKIIAELCQNHNGDPNILEEMIISAANSGATHIKVQHIKPEILVFRPRHETGVKIEGRTKSIKRPFGEEFKRLSKLTLNEETILHFIDICKSVNVTPLTTCFSTYDIEEIARLGFKEIKVASYDCASYHMLRKLVNFFDHIYVSTGATYDREVEHAAKVLKDGEAEFSLLQCTTVYPTPLHLANIERINFLKKHCNNVGFSDHSPTNDKDATLASKIAITLGAKIIERHFTILDSKDTKDGPVSVNPEQLQDIVIFSQKSRSEQIKELENLVDISKYANAKYQERGLSEVELVNRDYYKGRFGTVMKPFDPASYEQEAIYNWEEA